MTVLCFVSARKQVFLMSFNCKSTILNWLTLLVTQVNANSEWVISTTSLKSGIYLVTLYSTDGKRVVRKVVKE